MDEQNLALSPSIDSEPQTAETIEVLPEWAQSMIRALRETNAGHQREIERLQTESTRVESQWQEQEITLAQTLMERDSLKPHAERAALLDAYIREGVERRVAALPEAYRSLVPAYADPLETLRWLDANAAILSAVHAPSLDAGARGDSRRARISATERQVAAKLGVTPEQYARAKK
ncbi:MAG: hypothetical protein U0670_16440 [Anaerolineae bacterium]